MPPKTRSSVSNNSDTSNVPTSTTDEHVDNVSTTATDSVDDSTVLATVLDSIKAAQCATHTITLRLTTYSSAIDTTAKNIVTKEHDIKTICHSIDEIPTIIDTKLTDFHQDFETKLEDIQKGIRC
jgi:ACT domain-containing protein